MSDQESREFNALEKVLKQLQDAADEAGERMSKFIEEADVKRRFSDALDALDDVRLEVLRRLHGEPATKPLDEMTVKELHALASERDIPGRSSMNKAELIDALRG
jgi:polyhydroxyalkanoate synthesis regulator phasin